MKRIAPTFLIAALLSPAGAAAQARAQAPCAAYLPGSPVYAECRRRADQAQRAYRDEANSFWWHEMDRRRGEEYRAGE